MAFGNQTFTVVEHEDERLALMQNYTASKQPVSNWADNVESLFLTGTGQEIITTISAIEPPI